MDSIQAEDLSVDAKHRKFLMSSGLLPSEDSALKSVPSYPLPAVPGLKAIYNNHNWILLAVLDMIRVYLICIVHI